MIGGASLVIGLLGCFEEDVAAGPRCRIASSTTLLTEDGATIALHHHAGQGPPVLLVHGIACNHRFWDLDDRQDLAEWLVDRGWDVWMLDLRGHGDARVASDGARQINGWTVDDYGRYDVDAAVTRVLAVTGYPSLSYVGHSMGGMVGAVYMVSRGDDRLASLVILGSPASFEPVPDPLLKLAGAGMTLGGSLLRMIDAQTFGEMAADMNMNVPAQLDERLYNPENLPQPRAEAAFRAITSPLSRKEMQHFGRMLRSERFTSFDGEIDYHEGLGAVTTPALVVAGEGDGVVARPWVQAYYDGLGGPKSWFLAGKSNGLVADYGHLDLVLGERAPTEIYPRILEWMERYRGG